jgi:hypothetical protein
MTPNPNPDSRSRSNSSFESGIEAGIEAEETLRLLAQLPPPDRLNERVHAGIRHQLALESTSPRRRGFWSLWSAGQRLQFAAAAALMLAVAGSMWTVNHSRPMAPAAPQTAVPQAIAPQAITPQSGAFGGAKAERVPATLTPIKVPPVPKKKPSPKGAAKPSPKVLAAQPAAVPASNP